MRADTDRPSRNKKNRVKNATTVAVKNETMSLTACAAQEIKNWLICSSRRSSAPRRSSVETSTYCPAHGRRKILHFNVTRHPTADWVVQQLREAFPEASPYRYVILDRDSKFDADVIAFLKATGLEPKRTSVQAPWQNGIAERWVGSVRREILDHVIALNEQHLRRLIRDYVNYHHDDRIHDALEKDTPNRRPVEQKPNANSIVISMPRLGGLHHRYSWQQAA